VLREPDGQTVAGQIEAIYRMQRELLLPSVHVNQSLSVRETARFVDVAQFAKMALRMSRGKRDFFALNAKK